ncbi:MAG: hypothetical protein JNM60_03420 [Candidatus Competibacteraceae bacterium]|nr:hypothetical protein [Candidatus Competibacteraceae bacterium]
MLTKTIITASALAISSLFSSAYAQTYTGKIVSGGGIDDMQLSFKTHQRKTYSAYCNTKCGDWFVGDDDGIFNLKKEIIGRHIKITIKMERNSGRVAGPSDEEEFYFIKRIEFLPRKAR